MISCALLLLSAVAAPAAGDYFAISVVDGETGRGVPLVELRTVDETRLWTDSRGLVAFHEPGLMDREVFFHVRADGYEFPPDGFGYRGKPLKTTPGGQAELRLKRINVAQRLYRVTGAGIYRDSVLLNKEVPIRDPLLNAQVVGSDSVNSIVYRGRLHWFWGDTNRAGYPLGTFHVPGATSRLPADGVLDPARGVDLDYFQREDGFVASTAEMPGEGPTWIDGLCVIRDPRRGERMLAKYVKVRKFLDVYERGLVEWDDKLHRFGHVTRFDFSAPLYPFGHSISRTLDGHDYVYFGNPYPLVRVAADAGALADPRQYEAFTCLAAESSLERPRIERDASGQAVYGWKRDTPAPTPEAQARWLKSGALKPAEAILALRDIDNGRPICAHAGSVTWNAHRNRWIMIVEESGGTSNLGELWYAEADTPLGPWVYTRKIVSHDKHSFYNPKQHAMFDQEGGRFIYFEGTYSTFFAAGAQPTPRYDYNQIMYRLDLDDPRVVLPVAVYETRQAVGSQSLSTKRERAAGGKIAFMALDRPAKGTVAVSSPPAPRDGGLKPATHKDVARDANEAVLFYALPADAAAGSHTVLVYEWRNRADSQTYHAVEGQTAPKGYVRSDKPLGRVWRYPLGEGIPWE